MAHSARLFLLLFLEPLLVCGDRSGPEASHEGRPAGQSELDLPHSHSLVEPSQERRADVELPRSHSLVEPSDETRADEGTRTLDLPHSRSLVEPSHEARPEGQRELDLPHSHSLVEPNHETRADVDLPHSHSLLEPSLETRADEGQKELDPLHSHSLVEPSHETRADVDVDLPHSHSLLEPSPETRADEGRKGLDPLHLHSLTEPSFETRADKRARTVEPPLSRSLLEPSNQTHASESTGALDPPHSHGLLEPSYETQADEGESNLPSFAPHTAADSGARDLDPLHSRSMLEARDKEKRTREGANTSVGVSWELFGEGKDPEYEDIVQGQLGDCYYLAGLAAMARVHPWVIKDAFVSEGFSDESGKKVYQLRFLVNGFPSTVSVDEVVPMACHKQKIGEASEDDFHFACVRPNTKTVWPILLEKGFAKVFGSYLAIVGGWGYVAFKALSQAPVDIWDATSLNSGGHEWEEPKELWDAMKEAIDDKFPITAGTVENNFKTAEGHAFAVIGVKKDEVKVYNPWGEHTYNGKLKGRNDKSKGEYYLTWEEFLDAFDSVEIARIRKDYSIVSYKKVPAGKPAAFSIEVEKKKHFAVQLEWPTDRFVEVYGCSLRIDRVKLLIKKEDEDGFWHADEEYRYKASNLHVELKGKGTYLIYAFVSLKNAEWVTDAVINVYAKEEIKLRRIKDRDPLDVGREILGFPCLKVEENALVLNDKFLALPYPVGGSPAWQMLGRLSGMRDEVLWVDELGDLFVSPSEGKLNKGRTVDFDDLDCTEDKPEEGVEQKDTKKSQPPDDKGHVPDPDCNWFVGEKVLYKLKGHKEKVCSEIENIDKSKNKVSVRFFLNVVKEVACKSKRLEEVTQCDFHEDDRVLYKGEKAQIVEVNCGKVKVQLLESDKTRTVKCGEDSDKHLAYPKDCPFYKSEEVDVWSPDKGEWAFSKVTRVKGNEVSVKGIHDKKWVRTLDCDDDKELKKLSRCDKKSIKQLKRFQNLDNYDKMIKGDPDDLFPPSLESIGPEGADCGDPAQANGAQPCDKFDEWGTISELLGKAGKAAL